MFRSVWYSNCKQMWISLFLLLDTSKDGCSQTRYCYECLQRLRPSLYHGIGPSLTMSCVTALILQALVHSYFRVWSRVRSLERVGFLIQNYPFLLTLRGCKTYFESKLVYCAVVGALDWQHAKEVRDLTETLEELKLHVNILVVWYGQHAVANIA